VAFARAQTHVIESMFNMNVAGARASPTARARSASVVGAACLPASVLQPQLQL
jgi:hypothetical protein